MKLFTNAQINTYQEKEKRLPLKPGKHVYVVKHDNDGIYSDGEEGK